MTRNALETAVRAWLVATGAQSGIPNADSAVIFADEDGVRPPLPYLTVRVLVYDVDVHVDERIDKVDEDDAPTWESRGLRTGTVAVNSYGAGGEAWLERAAFMINAPSSQAVLQPAGVVIRTNGGINNLSGLLDDGTEVRFERDFSVDYERRASETEVEGLVELETVVHEDTFAGSPDDRVVTITEVL